MASPLSTAKIAGIMPVIKAPPVSPSAAMLIGPSGTGKTSALLTFLLKKIKLNVLVTEGNGVEVLLDALRRLKRQHRDVDDRLLHWKAVTPSNMDIDTMLRKLDLSNRMGVGALQKVEAGLERDKYPQFANVVRACAPFISDRNGENLGNIASWGSDTAFGVDSLTGLNQMAIQHVCGIRPTMTQPEYGVVQSHLRDLISLWTSLRCFFVLTAHVERETNDVSGEVRVMASTVGQKLAPSLPAMFSDVILSGVKGEGFYWSTKDSKTDVKYRNLPRSETLKPDFGPIVDAYHQRLKEAEMEDVNDPGLTNLTA